MTRIKLEYVHEYRSRERTYYYFRRRGFKRIRLPDPAGSAEFMAAYERARSVSEPKHIGANRTKPGTVNAAIVGYYTCLAFQELAPSTREHRRILLEKFRAQHGDKSIATLPAAFIKHLLDSKKPAAARNWFKTLCHMLDFAVAEGFRADNPARGLKLPKMKSGHRRASTAAEILQYEHAHPIGSKARLALALGLYTIQRAGDVIRMGRQHIRNGELVVRQGKTGTQLTLPIRAELQAILDASTGGNMSFLVTDAGRQYSRPDFSRQFRVWCNEADLPRDCVFHGLRATGCTQLADAGCSAHQIAAWSGHMTLKEVERYTRAADQRRLARSAIGRTDSEQLVANISDKSG